LPLLPSLQLSPLQQRVLQSALPVVHPVVARVINTVVEQLLVFLRESPMIVHWYQPKHRPLLPIVSAIHSGLVTKVTSVTSVMT
jgi:hypothetical protein